MNKNRLTDTCDTCNACIIRVCGKTVTSVGVQPKATCCKRSLKHKTIPLKEIILNLFLCTICRMEEGIRQYDDCHVSCPICSIILPKECDINDHIDSHLYYRCPLCPAQLAKEVCSFDDFDHHVQSHID